MRSFALGIILFAATYSDIANAGPYPSECLLESSVAGSGFEKTEELNNFSEEVLRAEVRGFVNGLLTSAYLGAPRACVEFFNDCMAGNTDSQLAAVLRKRLAERPEDWNLPANIFMATTFREMCIARS